MIINNIFPFKINNTCKKSNNNRLLDNLASTNTLSAPKNDIFVKSKDISFGDNCTATQDQEYTFDKGQLRYIADTMFSAISECGLPLYVINTTNNLQAYAKQAVEAHCREQSFPIPDGYEENFLTDLLKYLNEIGIEDQSLVKIYANLFNERISKAERLSNWERDILKESQKMYAAIDAWACVKIYNELVRLKETNDYEMVVVQEEPKIENDETDIS